MAVVTFSIDTETGEAKASVGGNSLPSVSSFSYYGYKGGFDLCVCEEYADKDGVVTSVTHRAYAGQMLRELKHDLSKTLAISLNPKK